MGLPFESGAVDDLEAAVAWYERELGQGELFAAEVRRVVDRAARFPRSGPRVSGLDPERDVRRFVLRGFPYSVVTARIEHRRAVVAIAHWSREAGYWRERIE